MPNNYVLLDRIELNAAVSTVTFNNIPQTGYTDLKVVISARSTQADTFGSGIIYYYNGANSNLSTRRLYGQGNGGIGSTGGSVQYGGMTSAASQTANTFGNSEIYIPNYTGSTNKSSSSDGVSENNATNNQMMLSANLWSSTAAITSITFLLEDSSNYVAGSTFSLYGVAKLGTTPAIAPKADGGNVIGTDGTYWYHAFLSNGTFTPQVNLTADVLTIAGGGGGGCGGGGAGGVVYNAATALANATNYTITVGSGGVAGVGNTSQGTNGSNSSVTGGALSLTAAVGGGKGGTANRPAINYDGGSGGGSNRQSDTPGAATSGQGSAGGFGFTDNASFDCGGGGGGFSVAGTAANSGACGAGGNGTSAYSSWGIATATGQNVSGTYWYAGGGSGGSNLSKTLYAAGNGGGGAGAIGTTATSGTVNTGGGGGGSNTGGAGGSGIVIIRYLVA